MLKMTALALSIANSEAGSSRMGTERNDLVTKSGPITAIKRSALVEISYTRATARFSVQISNAWTKKMLQSTGCNFASLADARKFLKGRLTIPRARFELSKRKVAIYASKKGILALASTESVDDKTLVARTLVSSNLKGLNAALAKAKAEKISAVSNACGINGSTNSGALGNLAILQLWQKSAEVVCEYAGQLAQFKPTDPQGQTFKEELRALDPSIGREESRVLNSRLAQFNEAIQTERDLRKKVKSLRDIMDCRQRNSINYFLWLRQTWLR